MADTRSLRGLLGLAAWRRLTLAYFLSIFPQTMSLLAVQVAGQTVTGSLGEGALLVGLSGLLSGGLGPWRGRRMDRRSVRRELQGSCLLISLAFLLFALCVWFDAPFALMVVGALAQGAGFAGMWAGFRALLLRSTSSRQVRQAHFVQSLVTELGYASGPLLVTATLLMWNVGATLCLMAVIEIAGAFSLTRVGDLEMAKVLRAAESPGKIAHAPLVAICGCAFVLSLGFALIETNIPARMPEYGLGAGKAGLFMAVLATGSCIGGLFVSIRPVPYKHPARSAGILFITFAALTLPSALAPNALLFAILLAMNSLMLVPLSGLGAAEVERHLGAGRRGESFAYYNSATRLGGGAGATLNGLLLFFTEAWHVPLIASGAYLTTGLGLAVVAVSYKTTRSHPRRGLRCAAARVGEARGAIPASRDENKDRTISPVTLIATGGSDDPDGE